MRAGFTTIEVLMALLVFTVGVVALASGATALVRLEGDSWRRVRALVVAEGQLEAIRAACPDSGVGVVVVASAVPRAGRLDRADTLATEIACN